MMTTYWRNKSGCTIRLFSNFRRTRLKHQFICILKTVFYLKF